jgi:antitoxin component YwqK of YwqJK toxin-antitoxin module
MNQVIDGEKEGYWEEYSNGNLHFKGNFKSGLKEGYWEWYYSNGKLKTQEIYI